jgi:hypothetical protein
MINIFVRISELTGSFTIIPVINTYEVFGDRNSVEGTVAHYRLNDSGFETP